MSMASEGVQLLLCDESGDPGRLVEAGAAPVFVVCMVRFPNKEAVQRFHVVDADLRQRLGWSGEFHWSKIGQRSRDLYFTQLAKFIPDHHAVVWDKSSRKVGPAEADAIVVDMMRRALVRLGPRAESSRLIVDGSRHRDRAAMIRRSLGVADVRFEASHSNPHLQLADMLAGFHAWDHALRIRQVLPQLVALRPCRSMWI
jgi:hypothetical protein